MEGLFAPPPKLPQAAKAEPAPTVRLEPELVEVTLIEDEPLEVALAEEETEWHYCLQGDERTQGPVPESKLRKLLQSGRLPYDTLVWNDSLGDWVEATRIPALSAKGGADPVIFTEVPLLDPGSNYSARSHLPILPLASASLVLGIVGILFGIIGVILSLAEAKVGIIVGVLIPAGIACVLAIIFGHLSYGQIKANRRAFGGLSLSKAGLILGYIVLASLTLGGGAWMIIKLSNG